MQSSSRAPVLSATRRRVSAWISYRALSTTSTSRQRFVRLIGRLSMTRTVSPGVRLVALVVGVERGRLADDLLVHPVAPGDVDPDGDRLVGLVGDDDALAHACAPGPVLGAGERLGLRAARGGARASACASGVRSAAFFCAPPRARRRAPRASAAGCASPVCVRAGAAAALLRAQLLLGLAPRLPELRLGGSLVLRGGSLFLGRSCGSDLLGGVGRLLPRRGSSV